MTETLPEDNTIIPTNETALFFASREDFSRAVSLIVQFSRTEHRSISFRPVGLFENHVAVVPDLELPKLSDAFAQHKPPIVFESRRVESIWELSSEERRDVRSGGNKK